MYVCFNSENFFGFCFICMESAIEGQTKNLSGKSKICENHETLLSFNFCRIWSWLYVCFRKTALLSTVSIRTLQRTFRVPVGSHFSLFSAKKLYLTHNMNTKTVHAEKGKPSMNWCIIKNWTIYIASVCCTRWTAFI